jgi:uncharacterized linocin/CFP29 family protein
MMDDRNAQVGWTDAQWNRVCEEVLRAWQSVRVAGSFLPAYGGLPRTTQVVPSEMLNPNGTVDERSVAPLIEISLPVVLSRQQVMEEDLAGSLLQFRRRAVQIGQLEDWFIFNGTYPAEGNFPDGIGPTVELDSSIAEESYRPEYPFLRDSATRSLLADRDTYNPVAPREKQIEGLRKRNPGALGLMGASAERTRRTGSSGQDLMTGTVEAITKLEENGYVAPYVCVYGRTPYNEAHRPVRSSISFPRDRLEPLIGRELLHSSAIDVPPHGFPPYDPPNSQEWQKRGVLISLAGEAVDLAIAAHATPEFRQVDAGGRYVFAVFERFALRIKDRDAIVPLRFG